MSQEIQVEEKKSQIPFQLDAINSTEKHSQIKLESNQTDKQKSIDNQDENFEAVNQTETKESPNEKAEEKLPDNEELRNIVNYRSKDTLKESQSDAKSKTEGTSEEGSFPVEDLEYVDHSQNTLFSVFSGHSVFESRYQMRIDRRKEDLEQDENSKRIEAINAFVVPNISELSLSESLVEPAPMVPSEIEEENIDELSLFIDREGDEEIMYEDSLSESYASELLIETEDSIEEHLPSILSMKSDLENIEGLFTPHLSRKSDGLSMAPYDPYEEDEDFDMRVLKETQDFLNDLLNRIIEKSLYVDPREVMRKKLDKFALVTDLNKQVEELKMLERTCVFLTRKAVEFFRRRKNFSFVTEDPVPVIEERKSKYQNALERLDALMCKEEEMHTNYERSLTNLESATEVQATLLREEISEFENLVKQTLKRDDFEKMGTFVEQQLARIRSMRGRISTERFDLLIAQHCVTLLIQKIDALEDLGNGLHMRDYEHLQTETVALGKKIEERNNELRKLRTTYNVNLHSIVHLREERQKSKYKLIFRRASLYNLLNEKIETRKYLLQLKKRQIALRKRIRDLSFQGGLLDKPSLMYDYDNTMEQVEKLQEKLRHMRQIYTSLQLKISRIEEKRSSFGYKEPRTLSLNVL